MMELILWKNVKKQYAEIYRIEHWATTKLSFFFLLTQSLASVVELEVI